MIFSGSRYKFTGVYTRDSKKIFKTRDRIKFNLEQCSYHTFSQGDTLDGLASKYYSDSQLWWVFLEANTKFACECDIPHGERLIVPNYEEVRRFL